jgi:hypothetical protein
MPGARKVAFSSMRGLIRILLNCGARVPALQYPVIRRAAKDVGLTGVTMFMILD